MRTILRWTGRLGVHLVLHRLLHATVAVSCRLFVCKRQNDVGLRESSFRTPLPAGGSLGEKPGRGMRGLRAILSKWLLPTRLETRTKESITYASVRVEKPERIRKLRTSY